MKRLALVLAGLCLVVPATSSAAPGVKRQQRADAVWMVPTEIKGHFIGYYASVHLDEPDGGTFSYDDASVGKGRCTRRKTEYGTSTSCRFESLAHGKASEAFTMDPLLLSAELTLKRKGETFTVSWEGGDPGIYEAYEGCFSVSEDGEEEEGEGSGAGYLREATATGHVTGKHLVTKGRFSAMLMRGAMVTECSRFDELSGLRPGQRARVSF